MGFIAVSFQFDGIPGDLYNLYLSTMDSGAVSGEAGSSDVEIRTKHIYRRDKPYLFGVTQSSVLEFDVSIFSPDEISAENAELIQRWLFGSMNYKKLQIIQDDMLGVYYNCFLKSPRMIKVGGIIQGFNATVVCDSPFAWEFEKTLTKTYTNPIVIDSFIFNNTGDNNNYLYPEMEITFNTTGGDLSITNANDNGRQFFLNDLTPTEVLTVNNDLKILTSSLGLRRLSYFNKKWFRFVQGINNITLTGNISEIVFTYQFPRKIGG